MMQKSRFFSYRQLALALLFATNHYYGIADENASADENVLVVTADYRQNTWLDSAGSFSLLDDEDIHAHAEQHFEELTQWVPNLTWAGGTSRARFFQIRGIGERSQYEGAPNPSVGFIVDDIDFSGV
ncbi:MAG: TonB-dependent receptor, partial [Gammaproteobacteria bacterium]